MNVRAGAKMLRSCRNQAILLTTAEQAAFGRITGKPQVEVRRAKRTISLSAVSEAPTSEIYPSNVL